MFTGLVQAVGRLRRQPKGVLVEGLGRHFAIALGDSVAVDGVCLTVAELHSDGFRADVSEETLNRSTLATKAAAGAPVNLEPALRLADRLGGHLVSGHVDGLAHVVAISQQPASWRLELQWQDPAYGRYICDKASVAVDGISLTVAGSSGAGERFWIAVIPLTWTSTTLRQRRVGDAVNLEADLLAKYTERLLAATSAPGGGTPPPMAGIDGSWLAEHGWA
ncbi:riboflavin synthase [Synechococcus sp. CS-602]|uniref:riboflavin synthase n=1 Tax=unclassified Synechococcus TaxID=2626047 RepID=UPI0008FF52A2|nr:MULTISPECIES: riboflavin synthase [unclassified Synechococcus]APD47445.1 riboflavin synthase subunit alpha [Synechococcus sp. SynAce01]MCT0204419.1 riboflavin synthase [Synechococcus sp. CS-602]MCT0247261.1 riboflavin synthase [Synechococcus sp. CS-601]TWB96556.1 riboflavin synthase alpha chain [Synechococcus sp. Ace-Pa]